MNNDPLGVLLRVRQMAVDQARRALAESLARETAASASCEDIERSIAREMAAACNVAGDDGVAESFAAWLRTILPAQTAAEAARANAASATEEARAVLAATRAGVRAVESMRERQETERRLKREQAEQRLLDEAASRAAP